MPSSSPNLNAFIQNLAAAGTTKTNYATEKFVTNNVNTILTEGVVLDINISGNGLCVSTGICGTNKTVVDIGISTTLGDLSDVDVPTPSTNQYLQWNGTSWVPGNGVSNFSITNLTDFFPSGGPLVSNSFLKVNNQGTSIIMQVEDVLTDVTGGDGILVSTPLDGVRAVNSNINGLTTVLSSQDNANNYFSIATTTGATRKIQKNQISLTGFDQSNFVTSPNVSTNVTGGGASTILTHTIAGPCVTITLDTTDILLSSGGTTNTLPITRGGTSAGTSGNARINLGLSYNKDIISYSAGEFQNVLSGDNIRLIGGLSGTSIISGGSDYGSSTYTGPCVLQVAGYNFGVNVNISSGEVVSVNSFVPPLQLAENISGVSLTGAGGSGAVVDLGVCHSYLSFGVSLGDTDFEKGYGIRYLPGSSLVQIKSSDTDGWVALTNKFGVSGLTDVSASSPAAGDLLIYDGVSSSNWISTSIRGTSTISAMLFPNGTLTIGVTAEGISVSPGGPSVSTSEFTTLRGISSNIQDQLNDKIQVNSSLNQGDLIMYIGQAGGVSEFTRVPGTKHQYTFLKEITTSGGVSEASFENIYHGFDAKSSGTSPPTGSKFCILDEGTSRAESYTLRDTSDFLTSGTSTGLQANAQGQISLNYTQLDTATTITGSNLLSFGTSPSVGTGYVQTISVNDFLASSVGSQGGLCVSGGNYRLQIPTVENSSSIIGTPYDGQLAYFYSTASPAGLSVLAVYHGSHWFGTCVSIVT